MFHPLLLEQFLDFKIVSLLPKPLFLSLEGSLQLALASPADILRMFRVREPLLLFAILWLVFWLIFFFINNFYKRREAPSRNLLTPLFKSCLTFGSILLVSNYVILVVFYVCSNQFFDHAEPNVAAVSWLFKTGHQLYPEIDAAERYINNYGPILYILNGVFLSLFQPSNSTVKILGGLAAILSLVCVFYISTSISSRRVALACCGYTVLVLLSMNSTFGIQASSFWVRPDPLLLLFVGAGLLGVIRGNSTIATLISAVALGCSLNLKISAFAYFIPIYALLYVRFGLSYTLASVVGSVAITALPFLMFSQISFINYFTWLGQLRGKSSSFIAIFYIAKWTFYASLPIVLSASYLFCRSRSSFNKFIRHNRALTYSLLFGIFTTLAFSTKVGVFENNMMPFLPLFVYVFVLILEWSKAESINFIPSVPPKLLQQTFGSAVLALCLAMPIAIAPEEARLFSSLLKSPGSLVVSDIKTIVQMHPNTTIGMGYAEGAGSYELTFYRPALVFSGNPYLVDSVTMMEMQVSNLRTLSPRTLEALNACQTQLWLFPKTLKQPFDTVNYYGPNDRIFSDEFRSIFLRRYERVGESKFYDLWACNTNRK